MHDAARARWADAEAADLEDARRASDARSLSERLEAAVAAYVLTLVELSRRARTDAELLELLDREPPSSPSVVARSRTRPASVR